MNSFERFEIVTKNDPFMQVYPKHWVLEQLKNYLNDLQIVKKRKVVDHDKK